LQDFRRGCRNDDLKKLMDCPSEVLSHSAIRNYIFLSDYRCYEEVLKEHPNGNAHTTDMTQQQYILEKKLS
jgi:hypothetical protein